MSEANARFRSCLDRQRNALITRGSARPLRRDLELHLFSIGVEQDPEPLQLLGDGLAAMALYMLSRPRFDHFGWTIHLESPFINLFVAGSVRDRTVVGRAFTEGVHPSGRNLFYCQTSRPFGDLHTSSVEVQGSDIFRILEQYCRDSDQQPVRLFRGSDGEVLLLAAFPEVEEEWFHVVDGAELFERALDDRLKLIADVEVAFSCGCDLERIVKLVADLYRDEPEDLFRGDPLVEVECPRCGTLHRVARQQFDAALED